MQDDAKRDDGGPAFPTLCGTMQRGGMSLRQWFAGQALAGILANVDWDHDQASRIAYKHADAMLAEGKR